MQRIRACNIIMTWCNIIVYNICNRIYMLDSMRLRILFGIVINVAVKDYKRYELL